MDAGNEQIGVVHGQIPFLYKMSNLSLKVDSVLYFMEAVDNGSVFWLGDARLPFWGRM